MQRVIQLWQSRSARERTLIGAALLGLLLLLIRQGVVEPYRSYTAGLESEIAQQSDYVAKMVRLRNRGAQVEQQVTLLRQRMQDVRQRFVPGDTPALAASRLQERLQSLASANGLEVLTTVPLRDEPVGEFRKATVQMTLRGELPAIAKFVAGVENDDWRLAVSSLEVRGTYNVGMRLPQGGPKQSPLTVTLEVGGVMQGANS